ncbi:MAG: GTP cyclohydrolase MptA [Candidatus Tyrphobacter sp.]
MHRAYVALGSNLGDRRANILAALQRLRAQARVLVVSAFYETAPADGAEGPAFLNVAAQLDVDEDRESFSRRLEDVQRSVGRVAMRRLAARPIDVDLLVFDAWERPQLDARWYDLVPLAEIAPAYAARARRANGSVRRLESDLRFRTDRQEEVPEVRIALNRAGVTSLRRIVHLEIDGRPGVFNGEFTMVADLGPHRAGLHMSRFVENLEEATLEVLSRETTPMRVERLAGAIAREIVATQQTREADVRLRADFALERWTPVSAKRGEETYTLVGIAHAGDDGVRHVVGVEAEGMTACPCAQDMVREHSLAQLEEAGFTQEQARRALGVLPIATHNQRGRGSLLLGTAGNLEPRIDVADLVEIVESAMSSETYDLLKRPDEFFVVNKAHHNPKFVEDVVRGIVARALEAYERFDDDAFVFASQRNEESIHKHDAFAEAFGCFGEFRRELRETEEVMPKTDLGAWLRGRRCGT